MSPPSFRYGDALVEAELMAKDPSWITAAGSIRFSLRPEGGGGGPGAAR
ncbi:MAG: hypothetical protein JO306_05590 [Gemmatimonadetes bacterium]|nr:hypothetical protein [Gemmatimonadota bacterium]